MTGQPSLLALSPSLFGLPVEIRHHIYQFLIPAELQILPLPHVDIASVTRRPPSTSLLLVNKMLYNDILTYFMINTTWKINVQYSFNFFQRDPELSGFATWALLPHIRKAEILVSLDHRLMQNHPGLDLEGYCKALRKRSVVASKALSSCHDLQKLVISLRDTTPTSNWQIKKAIFDPLYLHLQRGIISVGTLSGLDSSDLQAFLIDKTSA